MSTSAETKAQSWPGTSSQLASGAGTNVTVGTGLKLSGSTLAPSQTVLDVDFTALSDSTQTLSNGNVTIGGVTYKVENAGNAGSIQFVNGSGFVISGKSVGGASSQWDYNGGSPNNQRTAPAVLLPWSSIATAGGAHVTTASRVRALVYIAAQSFGSSDTNVLLAIDNDGAAGATMYSAMAVRGNIGYTAGECHIGSDYVIAGAIQNVGSAAAITAANCNVLGIEVDSLQPRLYTVYYGAWSSGWPAQSALTVFKYGAGTPATSSNDIGTRMMQAVAVVFSGVTGGTGATVARLRVDVW